MSDNTAKVVTVMKNGFIPVPFKLEKQDKLLNTGKKINHYIYLKKHQPSNNKDENTIFIYNLPLLTNYETLTLNLNNIIKEYKGQVIFDNTSFKTDEFKIESIDLNGLSSDYMLDDDNNTINPKQAMGGSEYKGENKPYNTTLLKVLDQSSLKSFFNCISKYMKSVSKDLDKNVIEWTLHKETSKMPTLADFQSFYNPLPVQYLKDLVLDTMTYFQDRENHAKMELNNQGNLVDEDGFTLVVGKNTKTKQGMLRNASRLNTEKVNPLKRYNKTVKLQRAGAQKKEKMKGEIAFYRFQQREKKKLEIGELLSKFKQDQQKIIQWKESGKFNPYK